MLLQSHVKVTHPKIKISELSGDYHNLNSLILCPEQEHEYWIELG